MRAIDVKARPMTMNETTVVTVPTAYSAGEVTFVVIVQISSGSVFLLPDGQHRAREIHRRTA